jgi:hypothetical protein
MNTLSLRFPIPLSKYRGKRYFKFTVRVQQSGLDRELWKRAVEFPVISASAAEACNLIRDEVAPLVNDPTEIECLGIKGGATHRWIGYESLIAAKMFQCQPAFAQLDFIFEKRGCLPVAEMI